MSRMYDAVKDCIGYCRVTYHVVPVGGGVLRCDDDGFPFMPVLDDVKQYGTLFGVKRHDEQVVKDEQLASLNLLEFRLKCTFDFGDFQRSEQFRGIGI